MSTETRIAIKHSIPIPKSDERPVSACYESQVLSHWERREGAEVAHPLTYEIAWIVERRSAS
jgi:hypothetical protein